MRQRKRRWSWVQIPPGPSYFKSIIYTFLSSTLYLVVSNKNGSKVLKHFKNIFGNTQGGLDFFLFATQTKQLQGVERVLFSEDVGTAPVTNKEIGISDALTA
jgi:hypothetical protein